MRRSFCFSGSQRSSSSSVSMTQKWRPMASDSVLLPPCAGSSSRKRLWNPSAWMFSAELFLPFLPLSAFASTLTTTLASACATRSASRAPTPCDICCLPIGEEVSRIPCEREETHSVPLRSSFLRVLPNLISVVLPRSLVQSSCTRTPCVPASSMTLIISPHEWSHSSFHASAMSMVQSSPTARAIVSMSTSPMTRTCCFLAPYLMCRKPSRLICSSIIMGSPWNDTSVSIISTNLQLRICRGLV
mmetsp:Transcript_23187/g.58096  ORF Transcript_23187/g.58096 Transcript_23187/m.58096 type:complete len:245 (-) Transcript_23187:1198-1932(-)